MILNNLRQIINDNFSLTKTCKTDVESKGKLFANKLTWYELRYQRRPYYLTNLKNIVNGYSQPGKGL